jgi:hypothetical protein
VRHHVAFCRFNLIADEVQPQKFSICYSEVRLNWYTLGLSRLRSLVSDSS